MTGEVLVTHPGGAHFIYELVAALQGLGYPVRFEVGFFHDPDGTLAKLVSRLPAGLRAKLERELKRRSFAGIDARSVHAHPELELAYVAAARRFSARPELASRVMHWRNRTFDARVAKRIARHPPALAIGHDTSAIRMIRAARAAGSVSVLNQMIGHVAVGDRILKEEAALHPDWADSLHANTPPWLIEQCIAEAVEADHVFVPSEYVRRTMIEVGARPERVHILPYGVRAERFRPPERPRDDGRFRLLYVGQISQRKGLSYVLEAVKRLNLPDIELVLVGGLVGAGAGLKPYEGFYRHVRNVPHAEVPALFQSADVFVYPSLHEGSALAIFEAMASGLPVITTLSSGSMVRDGEDGWIIPTRDVEAIMTRILELRADPDRRRAMALSARARAEDFTWNHYRQRLGALLQELGCAC